MNESCCEGFRLSSLALAVASASESLASYGPCGSRVAQVLLFPGCLRGLRVLPGNAWEFAEQAVAHADERHPDRRLTLHLLACDRARRRPCLLRDLCPGGDADQGRKWAPLPHFSGRYLDTFEKRGGEWRIARRITVCDYAASEHPAEPDFLKTGDSVFFRGTEDRRDPIYHIRDREQPPRRRTQWTTSLGSSVMSWSPPVAPNGRRSWVPR